jgi:hypothetical protein
MLAFLGIPSASSIAKAIFDTAFSAALSLIAAAVKSLLDALFGFMAATTTPVFTSGWWTGAGHDLWLEVLSVSGGIMVVALMLAGLEAMWSGTGAPIAKALGAIPMAVLKTAALVSVVSLLVSGTDQVADYFDGSIVSHLGAAPALIALAVSDAGIVGMIFAAVIIFAVLGLWAELAVRAATIYLVVMTAPMVIAASVHPRLRDSWRKLAEIGAGLIFAKVLVALAFAVAFSELSGLTSSPSFSQAIGALVAAITTLLLSCFAPFVLFRLFSLEVAHLEGLARRPSRAARDAQQLAYYNRAGVASFLNRHGSAGGSAGGGSAAPGTSSPGPGRTGGGGGGGTGALSALAEATPQSSARGESVQEALAVVGGSGRASRPGGGGSQPRMSTAGAGRASAGNASPTARTSRASSRTAAATSGTDRVPRGGPGRGGSGPAKSDAPARSANRSAGAGREPDARRGGSEVGRGPGRGGDGPPARPSGTIPGSANAPAARPGATGPLGSIPRADEGRHPVPADAAGAVPDRGSSQPAPSALRPDATHPAGRGAAPAKPGDTSPVRGIGQWSGAEAPGPSPARAPGPQSAREAIRDPGRGSAQQTSGRLFEPPPTDTAPRRAGADGGRATGGELAAPETPRRPLGGGLRDE